MKSMDGLLRDQRGSVIVIALIILVILIIIGTVIINLSGTEVTIAANQRDHKKAFYAAESGRGYVVSKTELYHDENVTINTGLHFPSHTDPSEKVAIDAEQQFNGIVIYTGSSEPPRGSGYEVGKFKAHQYKIISNGYGPRNAKSVIEVGFYRIGF